MFHSLRMLRTMFTPSPRRPSPTVKLELEVLTERILPSASSLPVVANLTSPMAASVYQWAATAEQDLSNAWNLIAQEVSYAQQQWAQWLGITAPQAVSSSTTTHEAAHTSPSISKANAPVPFTPPPPVDGWAGFIWDPTHGTNASNALNWDYAGQEQNNMATALKPGDPKAANAGVLFDPAATQPFHQNGGSPITWDYSATFPLMVLGEVQSYGSLQTINANTTVDTAVSANNTNSNLNLDFLDSTSKFQIDGDSTITNMTLTGANRNAQFVINTGTTTVAQSPGYTETIGVQFTIMSGATLNDQSYNALKFTNSNLAINVYGTMDTYWSGIPALIDYGGMSNDYVNVNGGTLGYYGSLNAQDNFTVPVYVQGNGNFIVRSAMGQPAGAKLVVQNLSNYAFPNGQKNSVYMTGALSLVKLSQAATLECDQDYYQDNGIFETMDGTTCKLVDGAQSNGTAVVKGGTVYIDSAGSASFGELDVYASNLNFGGTLNVSIVDNSEVLNQDVLWVKGGNFNFTPQASTSLYVNVFGTPIGGDKWIILYADNQLTTDNPPNVWFQTERTSTGLDLTQSFQNRTRPADLWLSI